MTAREPANVDDARAQAAERLLERKRMGLESAVEALEAVGYRVIRRERRLLCCQAAICTLNDAR